MAGEIFISYRRADAVWARLLHEKLRAEGVEAWYDAHVGAGEDWRIATAKALQDSKIFVLLFSSNAAASSDIAKELAAAVLEEKLIVPVRLENIAPKGAFLYELASRNWINAYDNTEAKLAELAKGLARLVRSGTRDDSLLPFERAQSAKPTRKRAILAAAAVAIIAAGAAATWWFWPAQRWTVENSRPFIDSLALEDDPAFSPSGATLAYTARADGQPNQIYVRNLSAGEATRVTNDSHDNASPTWSSDGARLAYVQISRSDPCRIMVTTVPAGGAREVGRCAAATSSAITWQPGTSFVYGVERSGLKGDTIFRLDIDTGARTVIVAEPALRDFISSLNCSPDGKSLAYLLRNQVIVLRDLASGQEKILGPASKQGVPAVSIAWTGDSGTILTDISGNVGGSEIIAHPVQGCAPYSVYTTAVTLGRFATSGRLLALGTDVSRSSLARAHASPLTEPDLIASANGKTWSPSFAPDGTLAFLSNRSGTNAIWLLKPGASTPTILFDGGLSPMYRVRFSPDGTRLAIAGETAKGRSVKIMMRDGANVTSFGIPSLGLGLPSWTLDGKGILEFDRLSLRTVMIPIDNPAQRRPFAAPHWTGIANRKNGTFATRADRPGIWRIDSGVKQISDVYPAYYDSPLAFRGDDVLVPQYGAGTTPRILAQPASGDPSRPIAYAPGASRGFQSDFAVNPVTGEIVYTAEVSHDTNIDLLTLTKR